MTIGERFESSRLGQFVLSIAMIIVIVCVLAWNLPAGRPHDQANKITGPITQAIGMEQNWALFAPDPRSFSVGVYGIVTFRDGHTERWTPPHNGLLLGPYRNYRWQKYVERLRADDYSNIWVPTAEWVARQYGRNVVSVALVRTFRNVVTPGDGTARPPTGKYTFYTLQLP